MAHDVFISYASSDKVVADAVCAQLESVHRIRCWIAPRDVTPGASWAQSIIEALDDSKIMVLIFSSKANASMQIEREVERAVHKGINIIPLRIEDTVPTKTLEYFISAPHWLDALNAPLEQHIAKLATSIKALLARHAPPRPVEGAALDASVPVSAYGSAVPGGAPASTPVSAHVTTNPHPKATSAPARSRWLVPTAVAILLLLGVGAFAVRRRAAPAVGPNVGPSAAVVEDFAVPPDPPSPEATTGTPEPAVVAAPAPAGTSTATAPVVPSAPASAPRLSGSLTPAAGSASPRGSARGAARAPNLMIELDNNLPDDGSIKVEVDGVERWTQVLADAKGGSLLLPTGPHQITVTLLTPAGAVKETRSTELDADPAVVSTLKVRLSRFKRNLELQTVVAKPAAPAAPAPAATKDAATSAAAKPAAAKP